MQRVEGNILSNLNNIWAMGIKLSTIVDTYTYLY